MKWLAALLLVLSTATACAQTPLLVVREQARAVLAKAWDDSSAWQHERGYCATFITFDRGDGVLIYDVQTIMPGKMLMSSPYESRFFCADAKNVVHLHTHPPTTCRLNLKGKVGCEMGGEDAYECQASPPDEQALIASMEPFALIQCDRNAIIAIYPKTVLKRLP